MSEFQTYEFLAIDRPLSPSEMSTLRGSSSRATLTPGRLAVSYAYGSFKGDADAWMDRYFDVFFHEASWGGHRLDLRLPEAALPFEVADAYCGSEVVSVRAKGGHVVVSFNWIDEGGSGWIDEDSGRMSDLVPLRSELASGDLRCLYLGWLLGVHLELHDDDDEEPACPPGLKRLTAAQEAFVDWFEIDPDLVAAAAEASADLAPPPGNAAVLAWLGTRPASEKDAWLERLVEAGDGSVRAEILRRFRDENVPVRAALRPPRRVSELLDAALSAASARQQREQERAARERAEREREAIEARERHLSALAAREAAAWKDVDALINGTAPRRYDEVVALLLDLREVCGRSRRLSEAEARIAALSIEYAKRPALMDKLRKAGLGAVGNEASNASRSPRR